MSMSSVTVSDAQFNKILLAVGYPIITIDDLELTQAQIEELIIIPVLTEYYKFFPILTSEVKSLSSGEFSYAFPDTNTFHAIGNFSTKKDNSSGATTNPFVNERNFRIGGGGAYGTRYDFGMESVRILERLEKSTLNGATQTFSMYVNQHTRTITGYVNTSGDLHLQWMSYDSDMGNIPFDKENQVIELCQAYLMRHLGMLRAQGSSGIGYEVDSRNFLDRADKLEDRVMENWKSFTRVSIIRG